MTDATTPEFPDFETMTQADFEHVLPAMFENSPNGKVSSDPRLQKFLAKNPDCAALVRDLEIIAEQARSLFNVEEEPGDDLWGKIRGQMDADRDPKTK
ncbi:MAG: hypothetical protein ABI197_00565 [Granulicella sp.]